MHFLTLHLICILSRSRKICAISAVKPQIFLSKNRKHTFPTANRKYKFFSGPGRTLNFGPSRKPQTLYIIPSQSKSK